MALTPLQKAQLAEIVGIPSPGLVASELLLIEGTQQEVILQGDLARFQVIRGSYGLLNGTGKSGVEFDFRDERADIKQRIIRLLDIAALVAEYNQGAGGSNFVYGQRA